jgi:hypothetical protein
MAGCEVISMGDAGEGLVDAESRLQERLDELQPRKKASGPRPNPDRVRTLESYRLAKAELERQLAATSHEVRRKQIGLAIVELDRRMAETTAV